MGMAGLVGKVKLQLNSSGSMESPMSDELPRLEMFNGIIQGPSMTPEQEAQLLHQLECVLTQAQRLAKSLQLEPIELGDLKDGAEIPLRAENRTVSPSISEVLSDFQNDLNKYSDLFENSSFKNQNKSPLSLPQSSPLQLSKEEEQKKELLDLIHKFSSVARRIVAVCIENNHISSSFGERVLWLVDSVDKNLDAVISCQSHTFSVSGLVRRMILPSWVNSPQGEISFYINVMQSVLTIADTVIDNIGTSPVQYESIGKECNCILKEDYCFGELKVHSEHSHSVCAAVGTERNGDKTIGQVLIKVKGTNESLSIIGKTSSQNTAGNAANNGNVVHHVENDIVLTKLSLDKICGKDLRSLIECPFPSFNTKFQIMGTHPYFAYGGDFHIHRAYSGLAGNAQLYRFPTVSVSGLVGVKSFAVGGQATFDSENRQVRYAMGIDTRTKLCAVGITLKQGGTYRATVCKKVIDSPTTLAAEAKYTPEPGLEQGLNVTVGLKHGINPDLFIKARAGTGGMSIAVKKSWNDGKCTLKAAAHVNFNKEWRQPKVGVVLSLRP